MSLPTPADLATLNFVFDGQVFTSGVIDPATDITTLNFPFEAEAFTCDPTPFPTVTDEEDVSVGDEVTLQVTQRAEEDVSVSDNVVPTSLNASDTETIPVGDELSLQVVDKIEEDVPLSDPFVLTDAVIDEEDVQVGDTTDLRVTFKKSFSTEVSIVKRWTPSFSMQVSALHWAAAPITDLFSGSNPALPTISADGITVVSNVGTLQTSPNVISIKEGGLFIDASNNPNCTVKSFSVSLSLGSPGSFTIYSRSSFGTKGSPVKVIGLNALITYDGTKDSDAFSGYVTKGIFTKLTAFTNLGRFLFAVASPT